MMYTYLSLLVHPCMDIEVGTWPTISLQCNCGCIDVSCNSFGHGSWREFFVTEIYFPKSYQQSQLFPHADIRFNPMGEAADA